MRLRLAIFGGIAPVLLAVGGGAFMIYDMIHQDISGSVQAEGNEIGNWTLTPDICQSGFRRSYYGAAFFSSKDPRLALVYAEDPGNDGQVHVNIPGADKGFRFDSGDCKIMNASLVRGPTINQVRAISGTLAIDCEAEGSRLHGHLSFDNCH
jgi:hypothetical protein